MGVPDMDPWSTHSPILAAVLHRCSYPGPVLELGAGWYSTFMLHEMCKGTRLLVTLENNTSWLKKFESLQTKEHIIQSVSWQPIPPIVTEYEWAVALVDHHPGSHRGRYISVLKDRCKFIVAHDTEIKDRAHYGYQVLSSFKYRVDCTSLFPNTTVVSQCASFDL